ncbi:cysteine desulfurase [Photobacterium lipolyticum]|uniref:Cysteine desulfurase n=1 Tax=Photobacterium lipolyticum TaxID=266810 RepID=A0A2T3MWT4_9GAMM|nr:cysteine desulfurase [Photobacterium lipolyticum]PSW04430.1 cysteine desulfurase CsdA [Photobacterium lipolyticum]
MSNHDRQPLQDSVSGQEQGALVDIDWHAVRDDFPLLGRTFYGKELVYLDNAATTQKPNSVINAIEHYYRFDNANVHRGIYALSEQATRAYEACRDKIQHFIHAANREEIIFVRGTTEAINLVAQSYLRPRLKAGDEILISTMEHHSNIVPWQILAEQTGAKLAVIPITDSGEIRLDDYQKMLNQRTRLVAVTHVSNVLGTINPVQQMIAMAHAKDIPFLVDGAQAAAKLSVDVQALDCDFYAFSSHKLYGPTGAGVLYGKQLLLESMPPYQGGGEMISQVTFEKTEYKAPPYKFEAGTPNIAGVIGMGAAIDYVLALGLTNIIRRDQQLLRYARQALQSVKGLHIIGNAPNKTSIISFVLDDVHPHDISTVLDVEGVAIRAGHHCAMPLMQRFHLPATARASLAFYNNEQDIDRLVFAIQKVRDMWG